MLAGRSGARLCQQRLYISKIIAICLLWRPIMLHPSLWLFYHRTDVFATFVNRSVIVPYPALLKRAALFSVLSAVHAVELCRKCGRISRPRAKAGSQGKSAEACPAKNSKRGHPFRCPLLCWRYLSSRAVASQVLWAEASLTSVFGMGTGGPSP